MVQLSRLSDGTLKALVEGQERVSIESFETVSPLLHGALQPIVKKTATAPALRALMDSCRREFAVYVGQTPQLPEEAETALEGVTDPEEMVNVIASNLMIGPGPQAGVARRRGAEARLLRCWRP